MRSALIALVTIMCVSRVFAEPTSLGDQSEPRDSKTQKLEEVVVTAQKREERLQDVPIPISTISAPDLVENNKLGLLDFYTEIPGLTVGSAAFGIPPSNFVIIRGISTVGGAQTVSAIVDDLPFTGSSLQSSYFLPDIDPSSLSKVEVLRGPQGTLYGANSLGGLIKYDTLDPSTAGVSGNVMVGTDKIAGGAGLGYTFRGAINLPLGDDWAVRMNAFGTKQPGYIDDPAIRINGINASYTNGVNLVTLWRPTDTLSLRLTAMLQKSYADSGTFSNVGTFTTSLYIPGWPVPVGNFQQNVIRQIPDVGKSQVYGAVLKDKIGVLDLTVVSGYVVNSYEASSDFSALNSITQPPVQDGGAGLGVAGLAVHGSSRSAKFSQEVRISAPVGPHFDFTLGGFYTHEDVLFRELYPATDPVTGAVAGVWGQDRNPAIYSELAEFANLAYHATDRFDLQIGIRYSEIRQTTNLTGYSYTPSNGSSHNEIFYGSPDSIFVQPEGRSANYPLTYLLTPSYKISHDAMVYARVATGYRPGVANWALPSVPPTSQPDKTTNYDLGVKAEFLDKRLSLDASAYYIDWKSIQVGLTTPPPFFFGYVGNAGRAKSQGVELSIEGRPIVNLKLAGWVDWDEAVLTQAFPASSGVSSAPGDPLPYSARFSAHFSADDDFPISAEVRGFLGGEVTYVGDRKDIFLPAPYSRLDLPAYVKVDVRAGVNYGEWKVNLYANNVTNRLIINQGGQGYGEIIYLAPRTVGMNLSRSF